MSSNGFNSLIVEVAGVASEPTADLVGVLQTLKDLVDKRELTTLPQLEFASLLVGGVHVVQPDMVVSSMLVRHMLLELDDVTVRDGLSVGRG